MATPTNRDDQKRLVIIDGFSLLFRAFYGTRYLSTADGRPTNALFGFTSMLFQLFQNIKPDAVVVALDPPGKTFRHAEYPEYKGTRSTPPEELSIQLDQSRELINAFSLPCLEVTGYEADDVVGTVSRLAEENGYDTTIVTGDLDSLQLVDDAVTVMTTKRGVTDVVMYTPEKVNERYGFGPEYITDYKALVGDTSDNIPGVPGIGDKSATILIKEFGPIEEILDRMDEVPEKFRKKIIGNEEQMKKSKWLATIIRDAPVEYKFTPYSMSPEQLDQCRDYLTSIEFRTQAKKLEQILGPFLTGDHTPIATLESEAINATLRPERLTYEQAKKWIAKNPFAILPPAKPDQKPLLDEEQDQPSGLAHIAINNEVSQINYEDAQRLFLDLPNQAIAHETKQFYKSNPLQTLTPPKFDITLAAYVLQSGRTSYELNDIAQGYLDITPPDKPEQQAVALLQLHKVMTERLEKENQTHIFQQAELAIVPILAEMEHYGIAVSGDSLKEFSKELQSKIQLIQQEAHEIVGEEFNLGSPKQIGEILFDKMKIPGGKKNKTGWATGVEILSELSVEHPLAGKILEYRELSKLKNTYADALPKLIQDDGRIHTTFNQAIAATGRLSSIDPNLQNIPIRTELGRNIRRAFVAPEGQTLGAFDYSQIELRILAHMCKDDNLVHAFQEGIDVHTVSASLMFGEDTKSVSKEHRRLAKLLNYAVLYGVTGYGLANQLGTGFGVEEANQLIKQYNERFPKVKEFTEGMVEEARSKGFTTTISGRRRYFPDIHAGNRNTRLYAERQAINAPIQGTAADMIKFAMINTRKLLGDSPQKMLLQVHDELIFESPDALQGLIEPIRTKMETALPLDIPIEVDAKTGPNWLEMKEL